MIFVHFQGKPFIITVIQVYVPTTNAEETQAGWFYEDLQDLPELIPKRWGLEYKNKKSRDTWTNRQVWPWNKKLSITSWEIDGATVETVSDFIWGAPKSLQMVIEAMKLKDAYSLEGKL